MFAQFLFGFSIVVLDQVTKLLALKHLAAPREIIPDLFNLTLVMNPGAAFGMLGGLPDGVRQLVLLGITFIALLVVVHLYRTDAKGDVFAQYTLCAILAGAAGNLIDRLRFGEVVDFLDFHWNGYHWPAFNVADSSISVGVFCLLVRLTFFPKKTSELPAESSPGNSDTNESTTA